MITIMEKFVFDFRSYLCVHRPLIENRKPLITLTFNHPLFINYMFRLDELVVIKLTKRQQGKMKFFKRKVSYFLREFYSKTCLPGFKYTSRLNSKTAKISWNILALVMVFCCFYLIFLQYERYRDNVTELSFESNDYPVWKSPFPAITICNVNVVHRNQTFRMREIL